MRTAIPMTGKPCARCRYRGMSCSGFDAPHRATTAGKWSPAAGIYNVPTSWVSPLVKRNSCCVTAGTGVAAQGSPVEDDRAAADVVGKRAATRVGATLAAHIERFVESDQHRGIRREGVRSS